MEDSRKFLYIGAAVAGLAVAYMVYRSSKAVAGVVADAAEAINPLNNQNIINRGFTNIYQGVTGSEGTLGTDIYDGFHGGALDATSTNNAIYNAANSGWQAVGILDKDETIGTKAYDIVDTIKSWF